jgi:hypothetical protein
MGSMESNFLKVRGKKMIDRTVKKGRRKLIKQMIGLKRLRKF